VPERHATSQEGRANDPLKQSIGVVLEKPSGKTEDSAEDIRSDASRHHRQPRYHRLAELIWEQPAEPEKGDTKASPTTHPLY